MGHRNHRHRKGHARDGVSYIFSFFLSLDLLALVLLVAVNGGVFSERSMVSVLDDAYYDYTLDFVETETKNYTLPTGIDAVVLEDVFSVDRIQVNVNRYLASVYEGVSKFEPDTKEEREKLTANVTNAFANDGVDVSEGSEASEITSAYVDEIMEIYAGAIKIPGMDVYAKVQGIFSQVFPVVLIVLIVLTAVLIVIITQLHHFIHRGLRYIAYATGGATLMCFVVPFAIYALGTYKGLNVAPQYFYHFCVSLISHLLRLCMIGSSVLLVATIVLVVICNVMREGVNSGRHRSR